MSEFARNAVDRSLGPVRLVTLRSGTPSVVSVSGSFDLHPDIAGGEELVASIVAALLDKGTRRRDRFEIASELEDRGARVGFSATDLRLRFSATCLAEDLDVVMGVIGEELREPLFEPAELEKVRVRMAGSLRRQVDDTAHRAAESLSGHLFAPDHPLHIAPTSTEEGWLTAVSREDVEAFHRRAFTGSGVRMAIVGDVDGATAAASVSRAFDAWPDAEPDRRSYADPDGSGPGRSTVVLQDRPNLDVRIGHALDLRRLDDDYEALRLGCFVLGGNFSARLMSRVRDERGLTYGISSGLSGVDVRHGGTWRTAVTLSADRLEEGIEATLAELRLFAREGAEDREVETARETLAGQFSVSLATTAGMAGALLRTMERGEPLDRLRDYPARMRTLTAPEVNRAVFRRLDPDRLFVAVAGSVIPPG